MPALTTTLTTDERTLPPGTCLLCHTLTSGVTQDSLALGGSWRCTRCGQRWDARRLDAANAYNASRRTPDARLGA